MDVVVSLLSFWFSIYNLHSTAFQFLQNSSSLQNRIPDFATSSLRPDLALTSSPWHGIIAKHWNHDISDMKGMFFYKYDQHNKNKIN